MDLNTVRIIITIVSYAVFAGIIAWALAPANRQAFQQAALIPLDDDTTIPPTMEKSIFTTSLTETGSAQHDPTIVDVNIGETVTYYMTITMPEGTAPLTLTDNLPNVMTVVSSRVLSLGANITTTGLGVGQPGVVSDANFADGLPDRVVFNLGTVLNAPDGIDNAEDQIVLEVVSGLTRPPTRPL